VAFPNENQHITIVTGKGGVGKSTVAAALALQYARKGQRTLLVELGEQSYFQYVFKTPVFYLPTLIEPNFSVALWSGEACLREYVYYLIRIKRIVDLFFNNSIMKAFINAAPALKELAILGKVTSGIRNWGPPLEYDQIVVDCFSTGHMLALLRAPIGMADLVEFGPMGEQSRKIVEVMSNKKLCDYIIVTLAEELPVTEAEDLQNELENTVNQKAKIYCNRIYNSPISTEELRAYPKEDFTEFLTGLLERQKNQLHNLKQTDPHARTLPLVLLPEEREVVNKLAEVIS
jgi:anion-transporting  ArsA/GET3 family ATPase